VHTELSLQVRACMKGLRAGVASGFARFDEPDYGGQVRPTFAPGNLTTVKSCPGNVS
jgi:hypothetical protein